MTETAAGKRSAAKTPSEGKPEVLVNRDALIVGDTFYLIDEIEKVEITHMPGQHWAALACLVASVYLHSYHPELLVFRIGDLTLKASGAMFLGTLVFAAWGRQIPGRMVLQMPGKRVLVLERPEKELKEIRKKIKEAKKANAASTA